MALGRIGRWSAALALGFTSLVAGFAPAQAAEADFATAFDAALGTQSRTPLAYEARTVTPLESMVARIADGSGGRIGVYAVDLASGQQVSVLGDQRFPMASTSKIAIAATTGQARHQLAGGFGSCRGKLRNRLQPTP